MNDSHDFDQTLKQNEIKRLTESMGEAEPVKGILTDDEILKYAGESQEASRIRLKRGIGTFEDKKNLHGDMVYAIEGFIIIVIIPILAITGFLDGYLVGKILFALILIFLLCFPLYFFYLKYYPQGKIETSKQEVAQEILKDTPTSILSKNLKSFNIYQTQINDLKSLYEVKENIAKELIEKRFTPPQITYDKFISAVDNCTDLFNNQVDVILNMINLASEHTSKIDYEIETRINILKLIIEKIDSLTNELVINIGQSQSEEEDNIKNMLSEMETLINSIKDYN